MTRKEQNKILDAKIESNVNQYKVDRLNAETAFSRGDLNKYEFLKRIDLNYKPNCNGNRTHNHLVRKRILNHLAKLAK